jgi:hypothetical protein
MLANLRLNRLKLHFNFSPKIQRGEGVDVKSAPQAGADAHDSDRHETSQEAISPIILVLLFDKRHFRCSSY